MQLNYTYMTHFHILSACTALLAGFTEFTFNVNNWDSGIIGLYI